MPFRRSARQVRRVLDPVVEFLRIEAVGGAVLLAATITALVLANSPLADSYQRLWQHEVTVGGLTWDLRHWVNDALMTIFFLVIGLEVKRELTIGRLRDPRRARLPILAALAGAAVPALVFLAFNPSGPAARGWAIPMATDPAFAVGVLALLGSRIPAGAKAFLLALAVVDDIAAVTVIAVAYTSQLVLGWLALAALGVLAGGLLLHARVLPLWGWGLLGLLGVGVWWAAYRSGLHATIAGVALGFAVPARPIGGRSRLELLEGRLHLVSAYLVVPLFALANAGVVLDAAGLSAAWGSRVAWGGGRRAAGRQAGRGGRRQPGGHAAGGGDAARGHDRAAPVGAGGAGRDRLHGGLVRDRPGLQLGPRDRGGPGQARHPGRLPGCRAAGRGRAVPSASLRGELVSCA
jgi:Na+:H+ antiporter, NhaA family